MDKTSNIFIHCVFLFLFPFIFIFVLYGMRLCSCVRVCLFCCCCFFSPFFLFHMMIRSFHLSRYLATYVNSHYIYFNLGWRGLSSLNAILSLSVSIHPYRFSFLWIFARLHSIVCSKSASLLTKHSDSWRTRGKKTLKPQNKCQSFCIRRSVCDIWHCC